MLGWRKVRELTVWTERSISTLPGLELALGIPTSHANTVIANWTSGGEEGTNGIACVTTDKLGLQLTTTPSHCLESVAVISGHAHLHKHCRHCEEDEETSFHVLYDKKTATPRFYTV